ncbi:alpha/beta hydrolase [Oceaniglobus indicus]|uniref:alpha/beta hydrolase n=1 Tax=Oceaniglobus indicus TaxID=2047749 RepID=UPI000C19DE18|nr:alpha/beta hydrolase [Oceaniglobus indicus]
MGWVLVTLFLAGLVALPFVAERLRRPLDDGDRAAAPGQGADLAEGVTWYRWRGPVGGPVAVCVHGLTTPSDIFDPLADRLADSGYRVLTYDLPGRGFSDTVSGIQDRAFFLRQLNGLLAHQGVGRIDLLIGYSMGGAIATCFAAETPERVGRLVLLAPAGLFHNAGVMADLATRIPLLGDWIMMVPGGVLMRRGIRGDDALVRVQRAQTRRRGFLPGVLSSLRHMLAVNLGGEHRAIRAAGIPTLALWGEDDTVIPASNVGRLAEVNRDARHEILPGATHALPHTHSAAVMAEIATFVSET